MEVYRLFEPAPPVESGTNTHQRHVLIVDDDDLVRETLRFVLEEGGYQVWSVSHALDALAVLERQPIDIVLSDIFMPGMNGFDLLKQIRQRAPDVPVILITGYGNVEMAKQAVKEGASDFITKPYNISEIPILIERNLARHSIQHSQTRHLEKEVQSAYRATMEALLAALDTRDTETEGHSERVAAYTMAIAHRLKIDESELPHIERGALLHDIGKIGVPDAILYKPGPLTPEEWEIMKKHPEIGYRMCMKIEMLRPAAPIVLHHHERWDGKGYPYGLVGEEIPLGARIFAIADTLDAMTSDRPYRKALSFAQAREEIARHAGTQFDPDLVKVFLEIPEDELRMIRQASLSQQAERAA
ncbi:MAG: response regulator [Fimbriimonadales bacterium]|jgi:putative nucleotidyltransferase with HDIG domain|nr:response regulator [Fimbriimonadales bacterium]CUU35941.1 HDIG domain-containing protein [Armatimonadetes bacterium GXS]